MLFSHTEEQSKHGRMVGTAAWRETGFQRNCQPLVPPLSGSYKAAATGELGESFEIVSPGKKKSLANAFLNQIERRSVAEKLHLKWLHSSIKRRLHLNVCECSQLSDVWVPSWWETESKIALHCFLRCLPSISPSSFYLYMLSRSIHQAGVYSFLCKVCAAVDPGI